MANTYDVGDVVRLSTALTVSGTGTDPTTLSLKVRDPLGVTTTYTWAAAQVVRDSAGNFHYDVSPTSEGMWHWTWTSTGTAAAVEVGLFFARAPVAA